MRPVEPDALLNLAKTHLRSDQPEALYPPPQHHRPSPHPRPPRHPNNTPRRWQSCTQRRPGYSHAATNSPPPWSAPRLQSLIANRNSRIKQFIDKCHVAPPQNRTFSDIPLTPSPTILKPRFFTPCHLGPCPPPDKPDTGQHWTPFRFPRSPKNVSFENVSFHLKT